MQHNLGQLAALSTALLWSFSSILFSEVSKNISPFIINLVRLLLASFFLVVIVILFDIKLQFSNSQYLYLIFSGLVGLLIGDTFLYKSYKYYGARLGMLMLALSTPFSAILAFFFLNERLGVISIMAILLTLVGVSIVILQKKETTIDRNENKIYLGVIMGFIASLGQAVSILLSKLAFNEGEINSVGATLIRFIFPLILMSIILFIPRQRYNLNLLSILQKKDIKLILYGTVVGTVVGITLSFYAVANTYVGVASALMSTVPVMMLPIIMIHYKIRISIFSLIGAFLCVLGIIIILI